MTVLGGVDAEARWKLLNPDGATVLTVPLGPLERRALLRQAKAVDPGAPFVIEAAGPGAKWRAERFARRAGLTVERRYLPLPTLGRALYRVEDSGAARRYFADTLLMAPPTMGRFRLAIDLALPLLRALARSRALGIVVPGRILVGRRS